VPHLEHLFRPLTIGNVVLPCRIVSSSHQTTLVDGHLPTKDFVAYQEARARGGVGLIVMEAVAISPSGLLTAHTIAGYFDEVVAEYERLALAVRQHGTKLFVQLFHGGREVIASPPRPVVVSSSAMPSHRYHTEPRALRTEEVAEIVESYGRCAGLAASGGLDGIEITAAHGYLGEQFFNPSWNRRTDRYGEPSRFLSEVLTAVREAAPGLALGIRLSADSAAAQAVVGALAPLVDYVHVALGNSATFDGCIGIVPPPPAPEDEIAVMTDPFQVGRPLIATSRVIDPARADQLIADGRADAFGMNRALITDPEMPNKARSGEPQTILRCIGCNVCIAHYHYETPIRCAQNPRTGRELTLPSPAPNGAARRVAVVGGGPAGLAAAAEAAACGHDVVVLEREQHLGGQVWLAGHGPTHEELARSMIANYTHLLDRKNVEIRTGVTADVETVVGLDADLVVIASGARPFQPKQAFGEMTVLQVWDILAGARPEGRILIADWGGDPAALDCAELLAGDGAEVVLAVGAVSPGETLHQYMRNQYIGRLCRAGVRIEPYLGLLGASEGRVRFRNIFAADLESEIEADVLALSVGRVPNDEITSDLRAAGLAVEEAGDCRSPRSLEEAILEGTLAARQAVAGLSSP
jgi:2,4-dienoyl-CoA reductase-like NADH-dependent reductase (Old Yellow Enzyme family)/thioredoxin reductase